jgi:integrating conjugative element protein (TIGR03761 family)
MTVDAVISSVRPDLKPVSRNGSIADLGVLRSEQQIQLHTSQAITLWNGEKRSSLNADEPVGSESNGIQKKGRRYTPHNMRMVAQAAMLMEGDIKNDNPFADYWFDMVFSRVEALQSDITEKLAQLNTFLESKLPENFSFSMTTSKNPVTYSVRSGSVMYYRFLFLILTIDKYIRRVKQAEHYGSIPRETARVYLRSSADECRKVISACATYRHYEVTRDDVATNNQRAREAAEFYEKLSIVPTPEHIKGTLRNPFAPEVHTAAHRENADRSVDYSDSDTSVTELA